MKSYNIKQAPHLVTNQVIRRLENYLWDQDIKVKFGPEGRAIIQELVDAYVDAFWKDQQRDAVIAASKE